VLLFATGEQIDDDLNDRNDARLPAFQAALDSVCLDLAQQIVRDGEGATKFVEVTVTGAANDDAATVIAKAIGDSPLVKTALAAEDANWGRIVMAVGKAGQAAERDKLAIWIGPEQVSAAGMVLDSYSEDRATVHLKGDDVVVKVDVGVGDGESTIWTCDLTHGYIDINAGYRS
jgi:glutamate N-acetyltransferase/amino-acid N-acetyltransferase